MITAHTLLLDPFDRLPAILADWRSASPDMGILALLPETEKDRVPALQAACREAGVALIGAIFPALITDQGFASWGILLLRFDRMPPAFLIPDMGGDAAEAAKAIAAAVQPAVPASGKPTLFMVFDGMLPNIGSILVDLYGELGSGVVYAGVNAGSETFQPMPCLFDADTLLGNGLLACLLPEDTTTAVDHCYPVTRSLMSASSGQGNRIDQIDGRPAFDVYRDVLREEIGIELTHANFYDYAVHFPFGLVTAIDVLVRIPVAFNDDGSLFCVGEVPPNAKLRLLRAPALESSTCVEELAVKLAPGLPSQSGWPLLTFYCAGRRMHFGAEMAAKELAMLRQATGWPSMLGALSLGEIDSREDFDFPRFHNASLVCVR